MSQRHLVAVTMVVEMYSKVHIKGMPALGVVPLISQHTIAVNNTYCCGWSGGAGSGSRNNGDGGVGGGYIGGSGSGGNGNTDDRICYGSSGGTQSAGGTPGTQAGASLYIGVAGGFGIGGSGSSSGYYSHSGGGGGWYGGASGSESYKQGSGACDGGAGGGSGYINNSLLLAEKGMFMYSTGSSLGSRSWHSAL